MFVSGGPTWTPLERATAVRELERATAMSLTQLPAEAAVERKEARRARASELQMSKLQELTADRRKRREMLKSAKAVQWLGARSWGLSAPQTQGPQRGRGRTPAGGGGGANRPSAYATSAFYLCAAPSLAVSEAPTPGRSRRSPAAWRGPCRRFISRRLTYLLDGCRAWRRARGFWPFISARALWPIRLEYINSTATY
jgi:hypothetical protein